MAETAAPPTGEPARAAVLAALDAGLGGPDLLAALHAAAPDLSMQDMQAALLDAAAAEDAALFDLIAENYRDFFRLAQSVDGSAEAGAASQAALLALHGEVGRAAGLRTHAKQKLEEELSGRKAARRDARERGAVEAFEDALARLERGDLEDVERAAHDALGLRARLDGAVDGLRDGDLVARVQGARPRVDAACDATVKAVERAFVDRCCGHGTFDGEGAERALRAAAALGLGPAVEAAFADRVMAAFVKAQYTTKRLDGVERGSCSGLPTIYRATLEYAQERCGAALAAAERAASPGGGAQGAPVGVAGPADEVERERRRRAEPPPPPGSLLAADPLCGGVWAPVATALLSPEMSGLFDLGDAAAAHRAFAATRGFLEDLARVAGQGDALVTTRARKRLLAHPLTASLEDKWNLPVYFELVRGDLVQRVDAAFATAQSDDSYVLVGAEEDAKPSDLAEALIAALSRCWAPDVVLPPVADKFLGLAFELARAATRGLEKRLDASPERPAVDALAQLCLDVTTVCSHARVGLPAGFEVAVDLSLADAKLVQAGTDDVLRDADALRERCWVAVEDAVVRACVDHLRAVKGVNARYHLTGKPPPTEPSSYVMDAAAPLDAFQTRWAAALDVERPWRATCAARAAAAFDALALDTLDHAAKFEDVMAKRGSAASLREDSRKIALQLRLDLGAFVAASGCEADGVAAAAAAVEAVLAREDAA